MYMCSHDTYNNFASKLVVWQTASKRYVRQGTSSFYCELIT